MYKILILQFLIKILNYGLNQINLKLNDLIKTF